MEQERQEENQKLTKKISPYKIIDTVVIFALQNAVKKVIKYFQ